MMIRLQRWPAFGLVLLLALLSLGPFHSPPIQAQGGVLTYGGTAAGAISTQLPLTLYTFNGQAGDVIRADVLSLSGGLQPTLDLLGPDRQLLAQARPDPFANHPQDVYLALVLPTDGVYSLMVGGADGTQGEYLLQLAGQGAGDPVPLAFGQPQPVSIPMDAPPQAFTFAAEDCPTTLTATDPTTGGATRTLCACPIRRRPPPLP
ncbi:MAG: hypothetical protein Kow0077_29090 [Anaerolineae bacterium]